jgi:hypothetical protein
MVIRAVGRLSGLLLLAALLPACGSPGNGTLNPMDAPVIPFGVQGAGAPHRVVLSWTRLPEARMAFRASLPEA